MNELGIFCCHKSSHSIFLAEPRMREDMDLQFQVTSSYVKNCHCPLEATPFLPVPAPLHKQPSPLTQGIKIYRGTKLQGMAAICDPIRKKRMSMDCYIGLFQHIPPYIICTSSKTLEDSQPPPHVTHSVSKQDKMPNKRNYMHAWRPLQEWISDRDTFHKTLSIIYSLTGNKSCKYLQNS